MKNPFRRSASDTTQPISKKRRLLIIGAATGVFLLAAGGLYAGFGKDKTPAIAEADVANMQKSSFASTISATGTIATANDIDVYSTQTAPVKEVRVKKNESVEPGQIIAILDDKNLRQQIALKEASSGVSARSAAVQVDSARNKLAAAQRALANGTNAALVSAESGVNSAKNAWEASEKTYNDYKRSIEQKYNTQLTTQDGTSDSMNQAVKSAQQAYDQAMDSYNQNESDYQKALSDITRYDKRRTDLRNKQNQLQLDLNKAQRELSSATGVNTQRETLEQSLFTAQIALQQALTAQSQLPADATPLMIENAQQAVTSARNQIDSLQQQLNNLSSDSSSSKQKTVDRLTTELANLGVELNQAESDYSKAVADRDTYESSRTARQTSVDSAKLTLENAIANQKRNSGNSDANFKNMMDTLTTYRQSADTAKTAYNDAQRSLAASRASAQEELVSYNDSLRSALAGADDSATVVELANLYKDLQDMTIRAPMGGVVTEVNAKVGSSPAGSLFKIEALDKLIINTELKEFDINNVRVGMKVKVKTDATGDQEFNAEVVSVAPLATRAETGGVSTASSDGSTPTSSQPTFQVKIALGNPPNTLKAGMKARLDIITAEEQNIYAVPYSAVQDKDGSKYIMVARREDDNSERYQLHELKVTTSLENDLSIVVENREIKDGDKVLKNPSGRNAGDTIRIGTGEGGTS